jgi:hypothetical protein
LAFGASPTMRGTIWTGAPMATSAALRCRSGAENMLGREGLVALEEAFPAVDRLTEAHRREIELEAGIVGFGRGRIDVLDAQAPVLAYGALPQLVPGFSTV